MAAPPPAKVHVRPYKDYLTPSLHRRFVKASKYTLLLSYAIACWMGVEWDKKLWSFFPLGFTGIRTLLIFLSSLFIYVLRVAQWHVGRRQTQTPVETFSKYLLRKSTLVTIAFYVFSGWFFSEIYIWSRPASDKLGMIDSGRTYERLKLNERPLYLRYCFILLALAQSARHLWNDYDAIELPPMAPKKDREEGAYSNHSAKPRVVLMNTLPKLATGAGITATCVTISGIFLYFLGPRSLIWSWWYSLCKNLVTLSKTSKPTGVAPFGPLVIATFVEGTLLCLLWEFVNKAFSLYIAQEPLKHDKPITNDSPDPNGTLLNGLKSKKEEVKAIAFWELALITDAFPERRLTIYKEHDRRPAPTFKQITTFCLAEIEFMINRINVGLDPAYNTKNAASDAPAPGSVALVPQISKPTQDKPVTAPVAAPKNNWDRFERDSSSFAKSHSSSANVQQAYGREAINKGMKIAQDGAQQAETSINSYYNMLVFSILGFPFRHSLRRTTSLVVLGAPYSRVSLICNAITALTNLTVFSLKQDELGQFHEGVPSIIRVFTAAITKIDEYMAKVEIHKSDTETLKKPADEQKKVPEVEEVRECLRLGLEKILGSFNEFLTGLGLSKVEQLDAKKVAGARKGPEMMHVTN